MTQDYGPKCQKDSKDDKKLLGKHLRRPLEESKEQKSTKDKQKQSYVAHLSTEMGKKDAAESTRGKHIQMGAKTITKPSYNPGKAAYNQAAMEHTTNMAKKANQEEVDPYGCPYNTRLL